MPVNKIDIGKCLTAGLGRACAVARHQGGRSGWGEILGGVRSNSRARAEVACAVALSTGIANADVILNALARRKQPDQA